MAAAQAEHDATIARSQAELDRKWDEFRDRWRQLEIREGTLKATEQFYKDLTEQHQLRSTEMLNNGLQRDWGSAAARSADLAVKIADDPHFGTDAPRTDSYVETVTEPVENAPAGVTLTRTRPRNRRDAHA